VHGQGGNHSSLRPLGFVGPSLQIEPSMTLELFADMRGQILRAEDEIRGTVNKETRIYYLACQTT
jgi:hypothetical protein